MPEHYAIFNINQTIQVATDGFVYMKSPLNGFLQDLRLDVGANVATDTTFDVRKAGVSLWSGDLTQRPKILAGQSSVAKLGINAAIEIGDLLQFDVKAPMPAGGLVTPFIVRATLFDTIGLRSTVIYTTAALNDGATENSTIPNMGRGWKIQRAQADRACWVRAYVSNAARVADSGRIITDDATENAGLAAEIIFTASLLDVTYSAPFPEGYNNDDANSTDGIFAIMNRSGVNHTVQVTLQRVVVER